MKDIIISGLGVRLEGRKLLGNLVGSLVGTDTFMGAC